jgi:hypothetical protein
LLVKVAEVVAILDTDGVSRFGVTAALHAVVLNELSVLEAVPAEFVAKER